ncbi:MAG: gamma-glutamyltransferase [Sphingomonadaceae bacterium]
MFVRFIALLLLILPVSAQAGGGVVSTANPLASTAGLEILRKGGSATDAAMAVMLALTVVEPQSSGIGGGGFLLHHDGKNGRITTIDGRETAPASAQPDRFLNPDGTPMGFMQAVPGGLSVGVPGNIALMAKAHERWGKLPWAQLFDPAIKLAEQGYEVSPILAGRLSRLAKIWTDFLDARAIYWQDGRPKQAGDRVTNPALGHTLRRLAAEGPDAFYKGAIASQISATVANAPRNPAALTAEDLASYKAIERAAVCASYRVWRVCGMGPPSSGATTVLSILGALERFDMKRLGKDNPVAWHLIGEAMMLAYADRAKYLADGDFVPVPVEGLLDRPYLQKRSALIAADRTRADYPAGEPAGAAEVAVTPQPDEHGTTHFVVRDSAGNVVSMTSTVEGPFGSQLIAGGMFLNNELTDFNFVPDEDGIPAANRVEAGKRPLSSMSPTIVYDAKGRVVLALGSAGGKRIIMHVAKTLIGALDWGLDAQAAIALPNLYFRDKALLVEKGTTLEAMAPALTKLGHSVSPADLDSKVNAVERTKSGWRGAADPRSEGVALAE